MNISKILLCVLIITVLIGACLPGSSAAASVARRKRQFDLTLSADHDDKEDETEVALEAIANLWRSSDGNTQVEGSAKVVSHSNSLQTGPDDWRIGVKVVFT